MHECLVKSEKYFTDYVSFMFLIKLMKLRFQSHFFFSSYTFVTKVGVLLKHAEGMFTLEENIAQFIHFTITWYKPPCWRANSPLVHVLDVPVGSLLFSIVVFLPCDHKLQRAYSHLTPQNHALIHNFLPILQPHINTDCR